VISVVFSLSFCFQTSNSRT